MEKQKKEEKFFHTRTREIHVGCIYRGCEKPYHGESEEQNSIEYFERCEETALKELLKNNSVVIRSAD